MTATLSGANELVVSTQTTPSPLRAVSAATWGGQSGKTGQLAGRRVRWGMHSLVRSANVHRQSGSVNLDLVDPDDWFDSSDRTCIRICVFPDADSPASSVICASLSPPPRSASRLSFGKEDGLHDADLAQGGLCDLSYNKPKDHLS